MERRRTVLLIPRSGARLLPVVLLAGALPAIALQACSGCSSAAGNATGPSPDASAGEADAPFEAGIDADAATEHDAPTDEAVGIPPDAYPDSVPVGWEAWTGWSPQCPLYVPGPNAAMPPPIEWEPCPPPVLQDLSCQRMKDTWSTKGNGITYHPHLALDADTGSPVLLFTRWYVNDDPGQTYRMVADADGPVHAAVFQTNSNADSCGYMEESLDSHRYVISTDTDTGPGPSREFGVLAGNLSDRYPTIVFRPPDISNASNWYHSDQWLVRFVLGSHTAWSWDLTTSHTVYYAGDDPDNLPPHEATVVGGDVFSAVNTLSLCGVMSWNLQNGLRPLLRWYGDPTRGASNFGTDGKDMVWTYSEGTNACTNDPPKPEVWTAPYTTDPAQVQATGRRLRSDVRGMSTAPYVVGFGYAMRTTTFGTPTTHGLFVVRVSDGTAWAIPGSPNTDEFSFSGVLGFTQQELFAVANTQLGGLNGVTIVRIRLDSLGPGTPPD